MIAYRRIQLRPDGNRPMYRTYGLSLFRILLCAILLTGCEILESGEGPTELTCTATCEKCEKVALQCDGNGRAVMTKSKVIKQ